MKKSISWHCINCGFLLGEVSRREDGVGIISMKYKDDYVTVEGGKVTKVCRKCGTLQSVEDERKGGE